MVPWTSLVTITIVLHLPADVCGSSNVGGSLVEHFIAKVSQSQWPRALVFDVGANNGDWGANVLQQLSRRSRGNRGRRHELVSLEPQQKLVERLVRRATLWNTTHSRSSWTVVPAVAWTHDVANLTFFQSNFSEASSLVAEQALAFSNPGPWCGGGGKDCAPPTAVRAVDFGLLLHRLVLGSDRAHAPPVPVLIKLDVEASEYDLLPKLLVSGALCTATHLLIEWHLNAISPPRRLEALALRHSLESLLSRGCSAMRPERQPPIVVHDEDPGNNFGEAVPGLEDLRARHQAAKHDYAMVRPFALAHAHGAAAEAEASLSSRASNESERRHRRNARQWLDGSSNGYCAATDIGKSDCEGGTKGSWPLPAGPARTSWTAAVRFCVQKCAGCKLCRFMSVSPQYSDCSWFARCDLRALKHKPAGFRTGGFASWLV